MALDKLTIINNGGLSTTSDYRVGVLTATKFVGPIESGSATFTGSVSIGGTLTYEDVTNIDSVGIITARNGIDCNGDIDVDGHTNLDNVSVAGISTLGSGSSGSVNLEYQGVSRLTTTSTGVKIWQGTNSSTGRFLIVKQGLNSNYVNLAAENSGGGDAYLDINTYLLDVKTDGISRLQVRNDGNVKINETLRVSGITTFFNNVHLLDNDNLYIGGSVGTTDGIRIFHNGSTSYITDNGTGDLVINSVDGSLQLRVNDTESSIKCLENGAVELYHDNLKKLSTNTTGIEIHANESNNANIYMTADEGDDNGDEWILQSQASTNNFNFYNNTSGSAALKLSIKPDGEVDFYGDLVIPANITHQGDTNTKIRFPGTDTISFETASNERLRITSGGRVFIGETSVAGSANLVIGNGGAENFEFTSGMASSYEGGVLEYIHRGDGNTRPNLNYYVNNTGAHKFWTAGSERLRITSDGKIGIGQNAPSSMLTIKGTGGGSSGIRFDNSHDYVSAYFNDDNNNSNFIITYAGTGGAELTIHADGTLGLNEANGDNVLIGTSTDLDNSKLTIKKAAVGLTTAIALGNGNASGEGSKIIATKSLVLSADYDNNNSTDKSYLGFETDGTERLRITSAGKIGINESSPDSILSVMNPTNLGTTAGDLQEILRLEGHVTNDGILDFKNVRLSNGNSWTTSTFRIQRQIDATKFGYIDFGTGTGSAGRDIQFGNGSGTIMMHLDNTGNVGINTTSESILGMSRYLSVSARNITNGGSAIEIVGNRTGSDQTLGVINFVNDASNVAQITAQYQGSTTNGSLQFFTSGDERLRITSAGKVGIGEDNPSYRLQVQSDGTSTTAAGNIVARFQSNGSGRDATIQLSDNVANSATISMLSSNLIFKQAGAETLHIASNGNVSINNDLDVDGHANLDNVSIAGVTTFTGDSFFNNTVDFNTSGYNFNLNRDNNDRISFSFNANSTREWALYHQADGALNFLRSSGTGSFEVNNNRVLTTADEGSGNGLDADTLDNLQATSFLRSNVADSMTSSTANTPTLIVENTAGAGNATNTGSIIADFKGDSDALRIRNIGGGDYGIYNTQQINGIEIYDGTGGVRILYNGNIGVEFDNGNNYGDFKGVPTVNGTNLVRASDTIASATNADTVDSLHATSFIRSDANDTSTGKLTIIRDNSGTEPYIALDIHNTGTSAGIALDCQATGGHKYEIQASNAGQLLFYNRTNNAYAMSIDSSGNLRRGTYTGHLFWHAGNDGAGSGLDSDKVDGLHATSFLRSDQADTFSGDLTSSGSARILIKKTDNNVSDHIQFYNGTTRIGEIGCEDTTWLRINQETNKNIYTPRYIRADAGFFVDGTSKGINGSGNFIGGTIAGASDYSTLIRSNANDNVTGHTEWQDNYQVRLGNDADLKIYHNGNNSVIEDSGTGNLNIRTSALAVKNAAGNENMIVANQNGNVELYYDNDRVFYTETRGVRLGDNTRIFENSTQNTAIMQHADIHHAIIFRGGTNNNGSTITNENTTTFREYGQMQFRTGGNGNMPVRLTIASDGLVSGNLNDTSDAKFKENIVSIVDGAISKIKQLRPVNFDWKKEVDIDGNVIEDKDAKGESGFIAQEVLKVIPDLVKGTEYNDDEKSSGYSVNTTGLVAYLTKALQEVIARVEDLESKNNS